MANDTNECYLEMLFYSRTLTTGTFADAVIIGSKRSQ